MNSTITYTYEPTFSYLSENCYIGKPVYFSKDDINYTCKEISLESLDYFTASHLFHLLDIVTPTINGYIFYHLKPLTMFTCKIYEVILEFTSEQKQFTEKNLNTIKDSLTRWLTPAVKWEEKHTFFLLDYLYANQEKVLQLGCRGSIAKKVRSSLWHDAALELHVKGCDRLPYQCELKWKNLKANKDPRFLSKVEAITGGNRSMQVSAKLGRNRYR
ncbi:949_t:CDS:2, partial [Funneliformis mosseae]